MREAFERGGARRVQLKTDSLEISVCNERSNAWGATREGVLRQNLVLPDGYVRAYRLLQYLKRRMGEC